VSADQIAERLNSALANVFAQECLVLAGKHMQRDAVIGKYRFLPGHSKQTLMNDIGTLMDHTVVCCRGVGFTISIRETEEEGVKLDINANVNPILGRGLVERGISGQT